jgi:hypothetical protein
MFDLIAMQHHHDAMQLDHDAMQLHRIRRRMMPTQCNIIAIRSNMMAS